MKDDVTSNQLKPKSLVLLSAVLNFLRVIFQHGNSLDQWVFRFSGFLKSFVQLLSKKGCKGEWTFACTEKNAVSSLALAKRRSLSYINQSIDLLCKSVDWFPYDRDLRYERGKHITWSLPLFWWRHQVLRRAGSSTFEVNLSCVLLNYFCISFEIILLVIYSIEAYFTTLLNVYDGVLCKNS